MHAVVNTLTFKEPVDPNIFAAVEVDVVPSMREVEGFIDIYVVQTGVDEITLVILGDDAEALDRAATQVGSPWMIANVVPLLANPPQRKVGPVLAAS